MKKYQPQNTDIVGEIKRQFRLFIGQSQSLTQKQKMALLKELGSNYFDDRFDASKFIEDAVGYSVSQWSENNFKLAELWQDVAKSNAAINNIPFDVATQTVEAFKQKFEI